MSEPPRTASRSSRSMDGVAPALSPSKQPAGDLLTVIAERVAEELARDDALTAERRAAFLGTEEQEWRKRPVLSATQAAELLGVSRSLVYELIRRKELPSVRLGRRVLVPTAAITQLAAPDDSGSEAL